MKLKARKYYKIYTNSKNYKILYTGTKKVYLIAYKHTNTLQKYDKIYWGTLELWKKHVYSNKIIELSKGDLFLELL